MTEAEIEECRLLTLPKASIMRDHLLRVRSYMSPEVRNLHCLRALATDRAILLRHRQALVAWVLLDCSHHYQRAYLYVAPRYRRQGLGARLLREAKRAWPQILFCPWDETSTRFFEAFAGLEYDVRGRDYLRDRARERQELAPGPEQLTLFNGGRARKRTACARSYVRPTPLERS